MDGHEWRTFKWPVTNDGNVPEKARQSKFKKSLQMVNEHSAGLDLHRETIWACAGPFKDGDGPDVKTFGTYTRDLRAIADWLKERGVTSVAMESTGVYWIPPFHYLRDRGFKMMLVNARETKLECINGLIQTVKRRARGFRNMENFAAMIYLQCGKLNLSPSPT